MRLSRLLLALAPAALTACPFPAVRAPEPGQPADVAAMEAVVARFRARPPHPGFPLAVAPVTLSFLPDRYPMDLRPEFASALADLTARGGRLAPIRPPYLAGVPVRREGLYDPYDLEQYLLLRLSAVGFSADSTRAALAIVFDCGPGCGSQAAIGLRRASNGGWRLAQVRRMAPPPAPAADAGPP